MFLKALGISFVASRALEIANEILEQSVIPVSRLKRGHKGNDDKLYTIELKMALTKKDIEALQACGAMDIIERGVSTQSVIDKTNASTS